MSPLDDDAIYDVLAIHGRYDRRVAERILKADNATFVTVLRDPISQFLSLWHFKRVLRRESVKDFIDG